MPYNLSTYNLSILRFAFLTIYLLIFLPAFSCASGPPSNKKIFLPSERFEPQVREIDSSERVKAMNERLMQPLSSRIVSDGDYRIGPGDLLTVSIEGEKMNKPVRVSSHGNINLPLIGVFNVKGLTASELEKEVRDLFMHRYSREVYVSASIKECRKQQISVTGAVEKPGLYEVTGQKTVLDMLATAGGFKVSFSDGSKEVVGNLLFLIRSSKTYVIELEELLMNGDLSLNLPVNHGDVINIPTSGNVFVGGEVKRPGGFSLKGSKLTLGQAIAMAGGLKKGANGSEIRIFRFAGKGPDKEVLFANVYAIDQGQGNDPLLKENDIVIVPEIGVKSFLIELRDTMKGIFGFGFSMGL